MLLQVRSSFEVAIFDASWNWFFLFALFSPFLIFAFAYAIRRNAVYFTPIALCVFNVAYFFGIRELDRAMLNAAMTEEEWEIVCQDTGRVFAPIFVGVPLSCFWTGVALAGYCLLAMSRKARTEKLAAEVTIECANCGRIVAPSCTFCPRCMNVVLKSESASSLVKSFSQLNEGKSSDNPYSPPSSGITNGKPREE